MTSAKTSEITFDAERLTHAVDALKAERELLLVSYCDLLALDIEDVASLPLSLKRFNQLLTDYAALGHFELFEAVVAGGEALCGESAADLSQLLSTLRTETDSFLGFGERYAVSNSGCNLAQVSQDLEELGPVMAERFEVEDKFMALAASAVS